MRSTAVPSAEQLEAAVGELGMGARATVEKCCGLLREGRMSDSDLKELLRSFAWQSRTLLAFFAQVGQKRAREIFFLGRNYSAQEAFEMGMVNAVIPHAELENTALQWAHEINTKSPTAQRMLKFAFNLVDDGLMGQQVFAGEATRLAYGTDEAQEGRDAFLEKRKQDFTKFPWMY